MRNNNQTNQNQIKLTTYSSINQSNRQSIFHPLNHVSTLNKSQSKPKIIVKSNGKISLSKSTISNNTVNHNQFINSLKKQVFMLKCQLQNQKIKSQKVTILTNQIKKVKQKLIQKLHQKQLKYNQQSSYHSLIQKYSSPSQQNNYQKKSQQNNYQKKSQQNNYQKKSPYFRQHFQQRVGWNLNNNSINGFQNTPNGQQTNLNAQISNIYELTSNINGQTSHIHRKVQTPPVSRLKDSTDNYFKNFSLINSFSKKSQKSKSHISPQKSYISRQRSYISRQKSYLSPHNKLVQQKSPRNIIKYFDDISSLQSRQVNERQTNQKRLLFKAKKQSFFQDKTVKYKENGNNKSFKQKIKRNHSFFNQFQDHQSTPNNQLLAETQKFSISSCINKRRRQKRERQHKARVSSHNLVYF